MSTCAVSNCKNCTKKVGPDNQQVSFHKFPCDPNVKEKWIEATGNRNWFPTKYSRICSIHFDEESFRETKKFPRLNSTAIPTIDVLKISTEDNHQSFISNQDTPLKTSDKRKLVRKLNLAQQKICQKNKEIKKLRERNRRKAIKIHSLVSIIECLKKKSISDTKLHTTNVTTLVGS